MNKLKSLSILFVAIAGKSVAQLPVSTTAENKNVILEEFTGIYCGFCPQGHAIANGIKDNNPNDVFLINVHAAGQYSDPQGGDPDFRTPFGSAIVGQSGASGFPAGTVNRHLFPSFAMQGGTAMGRGNWDAATTQILAQSSYVNVALEADLDVATRELTVDVELYFTATAPASVNLNVALLQNNIEGPQSGASGNPSGILPNGNYVHNHMLRHLLTGQWGDVITTAQGTVISQQYTYTIPNDLNGIPYELGNLELVAFVAEGQQEIINGNSGPINLALPNGMDAIDLEASTNMSAPSSYCDDQVTPEMTVTNNSSHDIDTLEVSYALNGGTPVTAMVYQVIAAGQSYNHTFPTVTVGSGTNNIVYSVNSDDDLTSLDLTTGNNSASSVTWSTLSPNAFASVHQEGFESNTMGDIAPPNAVADNPDDINVFVVDQTAASSVNWDLGAYENSAKSYLWNFYSIQNGAAALVWEKLDFSGNTGYALSFSHAYAQYTNENDKLEIFVSTDCGANWTSVWSEEGSNLATVAALSSGNFFPKADEWTSTSVDLSAYDGESEVMIKMEGTSDYGNNLYVDDINITWPTNIEENNIELNVYPNPSNGMVNVEISTDQYDLSELTVYNLLGELVFSKNLNNEVTLQQLDLRHVASGIYQISIKNNNNEVVAKQQLFITKN